MVGGCCATANLRRLLLRLLFLLFCQADRRWDTRQLALLRARQHSERSWQQQQPSASARCGSQSAPACTHTLPPDAGPRLLWSWADELARPTTIASGPWRQSQQQRRQRWGAGWRSRGQPARRWGTQPWHLGRHASSPSGVPASRRHAATGPTCCSLAQCRARRSSASTFDLSESAHSSLSDARIVSMDIRVSFGSRACPFGAARRGARAGGPKDCQQGVWNARGARAKACSHHAHTTHTHTKTQQL